MKITGTQFRNFYPQKSLNFDFKVYNYSSNHFEVGITGTHYVRYLFKSGIIKDPNDNIIGTFNKEPISINSYIREPFSEGTNYVQGYTTYKDYLNSVPITREGILATPTSIFSALVVKILDSPISNSLDLDAFIYASSIPQLKFTNFYSNEAVSGKITNTGEYIVDIFSIKSSDVTGKWTHATEIQPGNFINFFNYDISGYAQGYPITLNLETNFGNQSYPLQIQNSQTVNEEADANQIEDPVFDSDIVYTSIEPYLGEFFQTGISTTDYKINYILGKEGSKIDLTFEYIQGKTGDLTITGSSTEIFGAESINILYSGILFPTSGIASGLLFNTDFEKIKKDYELAGNKKDITFYSLEGQLSKEFTDLKATGEVVYTIQPNDELVVNKRVNDSELYPDYFVDMGGKTESLNTLIDNDLTYQRLNIYKGVDIPNNFGAFNITGIVDDEGMKGEFIFGKYEFLVPSSVLIHSKNLPTNIINSNVDIYPYRGVGYASLYDQSIVLSGDKDGSNIPFLFLNNDSKVLLFKNLSNIDYNGQYKLLPNQDLLKGRVVNDDVSYFKTGVGFTDQTEYKGGLFINSIIEDGITTYKNLTPFENVEDVYNDLYRREDDGSLTKLGSGINWNENNFIALNKTNDITAFYSDNEKFNLGITLQDRNFLKDKTVSTSINLITSATVQGLQDDIDFTPTSSFDGLVNPVFEGYKTTTVNTDTLYQIDFDFKRNDDSINDYIFSFYYRTGVWPYNNGFPFIQVFQDSTFGNTTYAANGGAYGNEFYSNSIAQDTQTYPNGIQRCHLPISIKSDGKISLKLINNQNDEILDANNYSTKFNPQGYEWIFYIFGAQLEENGGTLKTGPSLYNPPIVKQENVSVYKLSAFEYFVYTLYGIPGEFTNTWSEFNLDYKAKDITIRENRRASCGQIKCFESEFEAYNNKQKTRDRLYRYKGVNYNASSLYRFFIAEIYNKLIDIDNNEYLKIYTDLDKLYISKGPDIKTYTRNDDKYIYASPEGTVPNSAPFNAVNEILDLLIKYKNFTYKNVTLGNSNYAVPESYGVKLSPIPNSKLDNIRFSGYLNNSLDLNVQAGFCRYYLNSNDSKDFGYFYETTNFYDVNNRDLIDVQDLNISFTKLFPDTRQLINNRPKKTISSTLSIPFYRLLKNDNLIEVEKILNYTGYVSSCFFKKEEIGVPVNLTGVFYNVKKRMSRVWTIKIKNSINDTNPSYSSVGKTIGIEVDKYEAKGFATIPSLDNQVKYLEVKHEDLEEIPLDENDKAIITLTSYYSDPTKTPVISSFSIP
jgi:hypothetical protein